MVVPKLESIPDCWLTVGERDADTHIRMHKNTWTHTHGQTAHMPYQDTQASLV